MKVTIPETLAPGETLTDEQRAGIQDIKDEDWTQPPESVKPEDKEVKPEVKPEDKEKKPEDKEVDTQKTPEEIEAETKAKDAESAETARLETKAKELSKTVEEVKQIETDDKTEQDRIEKIAKDENITVEEVKENETKDISVSDRHGKDPLKLARALRMEQSEYGKSKNELDELRKFKTQVTANATKFNAQRFEAQMEKGKEDIISKYRDQFSEESADLSDDTVFERGKALIKKGLDEKEKVANSEIKTNAETKRTELIKTLPEEFKDFIPEVKTMLSECNDRQILDAEFDVSFLAKFARGDKYTPDYIKSLEEAAYKRGSEKAKIIPKGPSKSKPTNQSKTPVDITSAQKARAEEIYGQREGWTKERMYEAYVENDLGKDF